MPTLIPQLRAVTASHQGDNNACIVCQNLLPPPSDPTEIVIPVSKLAKTAPKCAYCRVIHDAFLHFRIDSGTTTVSVQCEPGTPVIMRFNDTLNDFFASWYLLYRAGTKPIPSWPTLGGYDSSSNEPGLEKSLVFIKDCMRECQLHSDTSHAACHQPENLPLPRRVLDVRCNPVKLLDGDGKNGHYCALSYRWGPPERAFRMTSANIRGMMRGIAWEEFPKLLQDAITVTRQLDVPFLWIDALCIIQGDQEDWETEAPKMGQYYQNSILTIAASSANEVSEPFLIARDHMENTSLLRFHFFGPNNTVSEIIARRVPEYAGISLAANSPLSTRAWTWQENVLSTRIVHFTAAEVIWECRSQQAFENGAKLCCSVGLAYRFTRISENYEYAWKTLIADYSKRELTYETDRLPAISGIASKFSHSIHGRYLAGIWEPWVFSDLVWATVWGVENRFPPPPKAPQDIPSWSWASVTGQIYFRLQACEESDKFSAIKLIDADCGPRGVNKFGQPKENSSIIVEAPIFEARLQCKDVTVLHEYSVVEKPQTGLKALFTNKNKSLFSFYPDTVLLENGPVSVPDGTYQSIRRARKEEVMASKSLDMMVYCLHLGGGQYSRIPNAPPFDFIKTTAPRYFYLVLTPVRCQSGPYPCMQRVGLLEQSTGVVSRPKYVKGQIRRVRLV